MKLETIIGLEVHAQLATASKLWCACSNDDFDADPNTLICPVCLGYPGALPVLNEKAFELGVKLALSLNCSIPQNSKFDRKNYFYPDLPMGYQISQFDEPISVDGRVSIVCGEKKEKKVIGITRVHLENDAGKMVHEGEWSLVDFNRSGSPLMEIVTEPDMRSPEQARCFSEELQKILQRVGVSEANMYKGQMRFDASISLRPFGEDKLYPRYEIKNLNSFRSLEAALKFEIRRQEKLWAEGNPPDVEATVGWIEEEQRTQIMRLKESAADYRYFPEPDLPSFNIEREMVDRLRASIPELPAVYRARMREEFGLSDEQAEIAVSNINLGRFFETVAKKSGDHRKSRTFIFSVLLSYLKEDVIDVFQSNVRPEHVVVLIQAINENKISASMAKEVLEETYMTGKDPLAIIHDRGMEQVSDEGKLEEICDQLLAENEKIVSDYKGGKDKAFAALVGKVMSATKGQANPNMVAEIMKKKIGS